MKLAHAREALVAFLLWCASFVWLWPRAAMAQALSSDVRAYDWASLGYACALGLLGGALALIVALATDQRVVTQVFKESARNAMVSPIGGASAYAALKALTAMHWFTVPTEARFLLIVGFGYAGISAMQWARELAAKLSGQLGEWLVNRSEKP